MSQYPSPYQPPAPTDPMYGYDPAFDPALAPARRAGVLMYVLAAFILLGGTCCVGVGALLPQLMEQQPDAFRELENMPGVTTDMIRGIMIGFAIGSILFGVALIVLGIFVRKGSTGAIITSIVLTGLAILLLLIWLVGGVVDAGRSGPAGLAGVVCFIAVPLAAFVLLLVWLIQAVRSSGQARAAQSQYMQQYWQYAYQQQMHQQQRPPPPPPPPSTPPPGDPNAPPPQG